MSETKHTPGVEMDWEGHPVPADEFPDTVINVWIITPGSQGFDETWVRGYQEALECAREMIEYIADGLDQRAAEMGFNVAMKLRKTTLEEYREAQNNEA